MRSENPLVREQMLDLGPYHPVSSMPAVIRDLSIAIDAAANAEALGDAVRSALGEREALVEHVALLSETPYEALPCTARERIGIAPGQKNVLVRVVLRALDRTLTADECNHLRDEIYAALHQGTAWQWVTAAPHPSRPNGGPSGSGG
ncbi:MAG: hypothetical protein L6R48_03815 [Planctomycetes bacterium]|nr:hypothetical protein [Planctomycetota bacterium]